MLSKLFLNLGLQNKGIAGTAANPVIFNGVNTAAATMSCNSPSGCFWRDGLSSSTACGTTIFSSADETCTLGVVASELKKSYSDGT